MLQTKYPKATKEYAQFLREWPEQSGLTDSLKPTYTSFWKLPDAVQLGIFYAFLSYQGCNMVMPITDALGCCVELQEWFKLREKEINLNL